MNPAFLKKPAPVVEEFSLSFEEEDLLANEITGDTQAVDDIANAINRADGYSEAIEDVLVIGKEVGSVVPCQPEDPTIELANAVSDMLASGMEVDGVTLVTDNPLAAESFDDVKSTIKKIWAAIVEMLTRIWGHIRSLFGSYKTLIASYKTKMNQLKNELKQVQMKGDIQGTIQHAQRNGVQPGHFDGIIDNWDILEKNANDIFVSFAKLNIDSGATMQELITAATSIAEEKDQTKAQSKMEELLKKFTDTQTLKALSMVQAGTIKAGTRQGVPVVFLTDILPGDHQIIGVAGKHTSHDSDASGLIKLQDVLDSRSELVNDAKVGGVASITIKDKDHLIQAIDKALKVIEITLSYLTSGERSLDDQAKRLKSASDRLAQNVGDTNSSAYTQECIKTLLRLNKSFAVNTTTTSDSMCKVIKQQLGSLEAFVKAALAEYKHVETKPATTP